MDEFTNQNNPQQPESVNNSSVNHATSPQPNPYYQNQGFAQQNYNQQGNMPYATSPAGYTQNQQYNPQPQFNTSPNTQYQPQNFNTTPYENPVKNKQSKTGKRVFAILIVLCIAVASILIGISVSGNDTQFGNGGVSSQNGQKIDGATPDVEKSPYEAEEYSGEKNKEEIALTGVVVTALCGAKLSLFAPPSGSFSETTLESAYDLGYKVIMWSKDTIDWRDSDQNLIYNRATKNPSNGDLILMHPKQHTLKALPKIIDFYVDLGYKITTVSDNISN